MYDIFARRWHACCSVELKVRVCNRLLDVTCNRGGGAICTGRRCGPHASHPRLTVAPMKTNPELLTIQQVSARCGVSKSTLRFWEKRFRAHIFPDRSKGGQRRYSGRHVEVIIRIRRLQAEGLSLDDIRQRIEETMQAQSHPAHAAEIDRLAERISNLVREEVYRFLHGEPTEGLFRDLERLNPAARI
jgi:DNA-binding transcriptional MerR regulator